MLVTGATGRLGRVVCALLNDRTVAHRALVRAGSDRSGLGRRTWMIDGDLTDARSLVGPLDGVEVVLHLAGLVRTSDAAALRAVHVEGTRALLRPGLKRIVAVSSDTVLRTRHSAYAASKAAMEDLLRASDIPAVVLRPPMILGPGSPHLASLEAMARRPVALVPPGAAPRAPVHVEDVARAVLAAMDLPDDAISDGFLAVDLPGAEAVSFATLLTTLADVRGWRRPRVVEPPAGVVRRGLRVARRLGAAGLAERVAGMQEAVEVDPGPARELVGWTPRSLRDVLAG